MLLLKTGSARGTSGQMEDSRIDEASFSFVEGMDSSRQNIIQNAAAQVEKLRFIVPVPGKCSSGKGVESAEVRHVRELRSDALDGFLQSRRIDAVFDVIGVCGQFSAAGRKLLIHGNLLYLSEYLYFLTDF